MSARRSMRSIVPSARGVVLALAPGVPAASAAPGGAFTVAAPTPCYVGLCAVTLTYDGAQMTGPGLVEVEWDDRDPATFTATGSSPCGPPIVPLIPAPCTLLSPVYAT